MMFLNTIGAFLLSLIYAVHCTVQPELRINQGTVKGLYTTTYNNRQIASFEGIPYAKPPTGKLRFQAPVAAGLWYGVLNVTRSSTKCLQIDVYVNPPIVSGSEDCLYINVYTPQLPKDASRNKLFDVIAFIHGGAFMEGEPKIHGPSILLDRDVVLVTFSHRVGPLGFLSTEDEVVPGNNGLKDQVLALKWIQENIAAFGGNPKSVTIGGLSAGGASCHYHLLSPLSRGLFKGAICMSGVTLNPWAIVENSNEKAKIIANELGCPTNESHLLIKCLQNRPADHIVSLSTKLLYWNSHPMVPLGPVIEPAGPGAFISEQPITVIKNKGAADVPTLISFTADEGLISVMGIIINQEKFNELLNRWDELMPYILEYNFTAPYQSIDQISQKIKEYYKIDNSDEGRKNLVKLCGDRFFNTGIGKLAKIWAPVYSSPMYIYKFSYRGQYSLTEFVTEENIGVCHADDIFYIIEYYRGKSDRLKRESDLQMSKQLLDVWVSFAANGTLGENWQSVKEQLPKVTYTEIKSPDNFQLTMADELGEDSFWETLGLNENKESLVVNHEEL